MQYCKENTTTHLVIRYNKADVEEELKELDSSETDFINYISFLKNMSELCDSVRSVGTERRAAAYLYLNEDSFKKMTNSVYLLDHLNFVKALSIYLIEIDNTTGLIIDEYLLSNLVTINELTDDGILQLSFYHKPIRQQNNYLFNFMDYLLKAKEYITDSKNVDGAMIDLYVPSVFVLSEDREEQITAETVAKAMKDANDAVPAGPYKTFLEFLKKFTGY